MTSGIDDAGYYLLSTFIENYAFPKPNGSPVAARFAIPHQRVRSHHRGAVE